jgi:hypothetical protein
MKMAAKTIVYNFITEQAEIIELLSSSGVISVEEWFCYPPYGTVNIASFADLEYGLEDSYGLGEEIYEEIRKYLPVFLDMHQRRSPMFQNTLYDSIGDFSRQFGVVYRLLKKVEPELLLFGNIPHGGHDYLLYRVARALGIRTMILFQMPICPRFMIMENIDDFGSFSEISSGTMDDIGSLPEIKTPFYMKGGKSVLDRMRSVRNTIRDCGKGVFFIEKKIRYRKYLKERSLTAAASALEAPFAYFPLHLQPEMTTSTLGDIYVDQVLAIERLARKMPAGMRILVKENPKQNEYQRPANFFARLRAIPNAVLVPLETDTFELIRRCSFVATVTGTAGWEAINMGKPALIFGKAWYENLPGVFKYRSAMKIEDMIGAAIPRSELESAYRRLMAKTRPGVVSSPYFKLVPGIDVHANNRKVAAAIENAIARTLSAPSDLSPE